MRRRWRADDCGPSGRRRPARSSARAPGSETSRGEIFAVGALVGGRPAIWIGQHVLLDHDPACVRIADLIEHRVDVEIAFAEPAKSLPAPDLGDRRRLADDTVD